MLNINPLTVLSLVTSAEVNGAKMWDGAIIISPNNTIWVNTKKSTFKVESVPTADKQIGNFLYVGSFSSDKDLKALAYSLKKASFKEV